jgi:quaternary ammonium compound-resistance protein SugE
MNETPEGWNLGATRHTEMSWILVVVAGLFEVAWAVGLKLSAGFTRPGISAVTILLMIVSFGLLSLGMKSLPAGSAYAVWTGIGAIGTALVGIAYLGEPATAGRVASLLLIAIGIIGLRLADGR